ncbi:hypothetical protein B0O99DRAFT_747143 [Bisporella sp. PMI_857]|nr:hypothetical protein B0O99DRAFT_747143 [Bisporella sp. PMI_857]
MEDRSHQLIAVVITFLCLALVSIGLRIWTRFHLVKWIGRDDWLILIAAAASVAEGMYTLTATRYGLGKHPSALEPEWWKPFQQTIFAASISYNISSGFIKLSLLSFYLRLSPDMTFRVVTLALFIVCVLFMVGCVMGVLLQCIPLSMLWDPSPKGKCFNIGLFYFASAIIHILTEAAIYILPIKTLLGLRLPMKQKLGLCLLFSIGAGLIAISCYRIVLLRPFIVSEPGGGLTWIIVNIFTWYTIELNLAICVACGPANLAFFRYHFPALFGSSTAAGQYFPNGRMVYSLGNIQHGTRGTGGQQSQIGNKS